jgi:hypothetical protein
MVSGIEGRRVVSAPPPLSFLRKKFPFGIAAAKHFS